MGSPDLTTAVPTESKGGVGSPMSSCPHCHPCSPEPASARRAQQLTDLRATQSPGRGPLRPPEGSAVSPWLSYVIAIGTNRTIHLSCPDISPGGQAVTAWE